MRKYTLKAYRNFLRSIPTPYILRHDVDRRANAALDMAVIESEFDIVSTYYFRVPFDEYYVKTIAALGHEIGYHYEVMDKAKGHHGKAVRIFRKELEELRKIYPVTKCAAHGNPLTPYNNQDFVYLLTLLSFGVRDATETKSAFYWTDTGRGNPSYNLKEHIPKGNELIFYYNIHPERWNDGIMWYYQWCFDFLCNQIKRVIKYARFTHQSPTYQRTTIR